MESEDGANASDLDRISKVPWCAKLLSDPAFSLTVTKSRTSQPTTEDTFFGSTLATSSTVSACVSQRRDPNTTVDTSIPPFPAISEVRTFLVLGDGVNGYPHVAHGGFAATVLDEVMGVLLSENKDFEYRRVQASGDAEQIKSWKRFVTVTAGLNMSYKKRIPTPGTILVRAWFDRMIGRKFFVQATIEDGSGEVYTHGTGVFIKMTENL